MNYIAYSAKSGSSTKHSLSIANFVITTLAILGWMVLAASLMMYLALWFVLYKF